MNLRHLWFGLSTVTGLGRRGFFIPYRYAESVAPRQSVYDAIAERFATYESEFSRTLETIEDVAAALIALNGPAPAPRWQQDRFPRADGAAAYALPSLNKRRNMKNAKFA